MSERAAVAPQATTRRRRWLGSRTFTGYALVAPSLVLTVAVILYPLAFSLVTSFRQYQLARPDDTPFVGLENYIWTLQAPQFLNSVLITMIFTVTSIALEFGLGLGFAVLLNHEFRFQGIV